MYIAVTCGQRFFSLSVFTIVHFPGLLSLGLRGWKILVQFQTMRQVPCIILLDVEGLVSSDKDFIAMAPILLGLRLADDEETQLFG